MKGVLVIDTAGPVIGVACGDMYHNEVFEQRIIQGADGILLSTLSDMASRYEITLVGVSVGPGAFTGLRVGVATALGFALARNLPVVPLSSLQLRALIARKEHTLSILDARKDRVYAEFFDARGDVPISKGEPQDISISSLDFPQQFYAVGEGAVRYRSILEEKGANIPLDACRTPVLEGISLTWALREQAVDPALIRLNYIRPPDAKIPKNMGVALGNPKKQEEAT